MDIATFPGTLIEIDGAGVLLTGASGIGKSETALGLLDRGHRLVCDDAVALAEEGGALRGSCPPPLQGRLAVRDLGVLAVDRLLGPGSLIGSALVECEIELIAPAADLTPRGLLSPRWDRRVWLGVPLPWLRLLAAPGRDLPLLVELAVRDRRLRQQGYSADEVFCREQQNLIEGQP